MAFDATKLVAVGHGDGRTLYMYEATDTLATITGDNTYFGATMDGTDGLMREGDMILVRCASGGTNDPAILCVEAVSTGEVTTRSEHDTAHA